MNFLTSLFSGGASKLVDSVGNTLDKIITSKAEKMQLDAEIKKADLNYQLELQKLTVEERKMMYEDLSSARHREEVIQQSPSASDLEKNISSYLAIGSTVLCFALFYILIFDAQSLKDPQVENIVMYVLGVLSTLLTQIYSYYFGSSSGSVEKSKTIAEGLLKKNYD